MTDEPGTSPSQDDNVVVVQSRRIIDTSMLEAARFPLLWLTVKELMREVPGSDFIEITIIRYDVKEAADERSARPAQDPEQAD